MAGAAAQEFAALQEEKYASLTPYRRSGEPVGSPMWVVLEDGRAYVGTAEHRPKAKRLHNDPRVTLAPCTCDGTVTGPAVGGRARVLEAAAARRRFARKYGVLWRLVELTNRLGRHRQLFYEVTPA